MRREAAGVGTGGEAGTRSVGEETVGSEKSAGGIHRSGSATGAAATEGTRFEVALDDRRDVGVELSHGCRIGRRGRHGGREREWRVIAVEAGRVGDEDTH